MGLAILALQAPVRAVVLAGAPALTTAAHETLANWPAPDLSGVARLENGCSAVLLAGGSHLLGAAHCAGTPGMPVTLASGESLRIRSVITAPGWTGVTAVHDLAVMSLEAPSAHSKGYKLATLEQTDESPAVLLAGFGGGGTATARLPAGQLSHGYNEYDVAMTPGGQPMPPDGHLARLFDFDDGGFGANTLGRWPGATSGLGLGGAEAMVAGLDSGGPSLVPVKATGWRSWLGRKGWEWRIAGIHVGILNQFGGGFGGVGMDLVVAPHVGWIEQSTDGAIQR